jgi:hypothetical protein
MFCTRCGTRNLDTDQFCRACNAPLVKTGEAQRPGESSGSGQSSYPYSTAGSGGAGQQQQPSSPGYPPYPGYQGYPVSQHSYANQMPMSQAGASGRSIAALVLGIVSLVMCCLPTGIVGIVLGKQELNAISEGRAPQAGETMAKVGFYLSILATGLSLLFGVFYFLGIIASIASN